MSVRLVTCPECNGRDYKTVTELDPKTTSINMPVILQCEFCKHIWEDRVMSHHTRKRRDRGELRV